MKFKAPSHRTFWLLAVSVILLDQATKYIVVAKLGLDDFVTVIPRCFHLILRYNTGAAFSVFEQHTGVLAAFSSAVSAFLAWWSWSLRPEELELRWPLGLILGGAVGNLIDRFRLARVIDFVDWHWDDVYHFPTFNVADSCICVGMGLLILFMHLAARREAAAAKDSATEKSA